MATYYVRTDGHDGATGLNNTNNATTGAWLTFGKAVSVADAGDTVWFADGTYTTDSTVFGVFYNEGTSEGNRISFRSTNLWGAKLNLEQKNCFFTFMGGISYITIDGFEMYGGHNITNVQPSTFNHHMNFTRNYVHDVANWEVTDTSDGLAGFLIRNGGHDYLFDSNLFVNCHRNLSSGGDLKHDQVIYMNGYNHIVRNNIFAVTGTEKFTGWAIDICGYTDDSYNIVIENNTFYGTSANTSYGQGHILLETNDVRCCEDIVIANNISYNPREYFVKVYTPDAGASIVSAILKNNIVYGSSVVIDGDEGYWDGLNTTQADNQVSTDPKFVTPGSNFYLQSDSPAIGAALATYLPALDFAGTSRPQGAAGDIGAYEYINDIVRIYSRGSYGSLPSDDTDLTTIYSAQDYLDVADDDGTRVGESGNGYILHQFKDIAGASDTKMDIHCNLQAPLAPSDYPVYLQCYDRVTAGGMWVTVVTDNTSDANTDFDMDFELNSGTTPTFANCKDGDGVISSRVYQTNVPLS